VRGVNSDSVLLESRPFRILGGFRLVSADFSAIVCVLCVIAACLITYGCGTTHAVLNFTAPLAATAGSPFTVTVTVTINGKRDAVINSRIHFTSSDLAAALPEDYYFTPSDAGSHTWTNSFILATPGNQTISGEIVEATGISGSANVAVIP
jgi:hypothetical protein